MKKSDELFVFLLQNQRVVAMSDLCDNQIRMVNL